MARCRIYFFSFTTTTAAAAIINIIILKIVITTPPVPSLLLFFTQVVEMITHRCIKDGYFQEDTPMWAGKTVLLQVEQVLHHEKSLFQDVLVFKSVSEGMVLVLDGVIQCTERDECSYQEMITHLPLYAHPAPKRVLVVGGGDGGVLREVVKHSSVEKVVLCEIDEAVIRVSKQYLPGMAKGFDHPKVEVFIGDGFQFMKEHKNSFDVIITDSSDPVGPAESLYQQSYYELMHSALREGGIVCAQGENQWLHLDFIKNVMGYAKSVFPSVAYAYTTVPTYPSGQIGFIICSKNEGARLNTPLREESEEDEAKLFKYYNKEMHRAAFVLPQFSKHSLC